MSDYQLGVKNESTYGTRVTPDVFHEFLEGDAIQVETGRTDSAGLRARRIVPRADRFQPYHLGAAGSRSFEVLTVGFEWWLQHMLGAVAYNDDAPVAGADTHTGTMDDLCGLSFTWQDNVVMGACKDSDQAFTYGGGKVTKWTLSCEKEGNLTLQVDVVFANHTTATALATASYPEGAEVMSWATAAVSLGGTAVPVTKWSLTCDNKLKTDRHYIAGSGATPGTGRKEPVSDGDREITFECEADFDSLTQWNRYASLVRANTLAAVSVVCQGPAVITGSTYPSLTITVPALRFDDVKPGALQRAMSMQSIKGMVMDNGADEPLTITYVTEAAA